jgi:hypothetical protein
MNDTKDGIPIYNTVPVLKILEIGGFLKGADRLPKFSGASPSLSASLERYRHWSAAVTLSSAVAAPSLPLTLAPPTPTPMSPQPLLPSALTITRTSPSPFLRLSPSPPPALLLSAPESGISPSCCPTPDACAACAAPSFHRHPELLLLRQLGHSLGNVF